MVNALIIDIFKGLNSNKLFSNDDDLKFSDTNNSLDTEKKVNLKEKNP